MECEAIFGAWRLERCMAEDSSGEVLLPLGDSPVGILIYERSGAMSVAIMRGGRERFGGNDILAASQAEKARAAEDYLSYAGRFELTGDRVRHHVEVSLFPNWVGGVQERRWVVTGDRLELSTDPIVFGHRTRVARMIWRRL